MAFLRHGPLAAVIPGGHAFHSARYWAEGTGGYSPYINEARLPGLSLELLPPAGPLVFAFGQPVLLGLKLTNTGPRPIQVPSYLLDAKAGFVEFTVRRLDLANRDRRETGSFTPIIARCFDIAGDTVQVLKPNEAMKDNVNLTFGAAGFPFAEPGFYEINAYLVIQQPSQGRELVVPSGPLRIRVATPHGPGEERDALVLFSTAVGRYFVLGGTKDEQTDSELEEIRERRIREGRAGGARRGGRQAADGDPVVVNILRAQAFRLGRNYHSREDGKVHLLREAAPKAALNLLDTLGEATLTAVLDPVTMEQTLGYRDTLKAQR